MMEEKQRHQETKSDIFNVQLLLYFFMHFQKLNIQILFSSLEILWCGSEASWRPRFRDLLDKSTDGQTDIDIFLNRLDSAPSHSHIKLSGLKTSNL